VLGLSLWLFVVLAVVVSAIIVASIVLLCRTIKGEWVTDEEIEIDDAADSTQQFLRATMSQELEAVRHDFANPLADDETVIDDELEPTADEIL
jgi:hypothetical protein